MEFSSQIKELREELNKSMKEISKDLEIPYRTWQDWEAGKRTPPAYVQNSILEKLNNVKKEGTE